MKKLLVALLFLAGNAFATDINSANRSSFTQTNDSKYISSSSYLSGVVVGVTSTNGVLKIYNSTWQAVNLISSVTLGTIYEYDYNDMPVQGVFYVTNSNTNGVTILYKR